MLTPIDGGSGQIIDLDEAGWATTHAYWMRRSGVVWFLMRKATTSPVLAVWVHEGDQPYYTARHVGIATGIGAEITAYGIGKKRPDGSTHRLWILPNGIICTAEDVDDLGLRIVRAMR
jgi:hypothetical protein